MAEPVLKNLDKLPILDKPIEVNVKSITPSSYLDTYGTTGVGESQYDKGVRVEDLPELGELRAQSQDNWDRWGNAIPRLISKVGTEVLKTPGYLYAIGESMSSDVTLAESMNNAWLNGLQSLDDAVKEQFAIYKPKSVIDGNIWDNLKSASFYTDEGIDGLGFLLAMVGPGAGLKALGIAGRVAKSSAAIKAASMFGTTAGKIGQGVELGSQVFLNSILEGAAETKGFVDKMDKHFVDIFNPKHPDYNPINPKTGQEWTPEEIKTAKDEGATSIMGANLALLLLPNTIMHKNLLGRYTPTKSTLDKITDAAGNLVNNPITRKQMTKEVLKNMGTSAVSEGFFEEGLQFAAEDYVSKVAKNQTNDGWLEGLIDSYAEALTTTEGQKSIFLGSLLGSLGGVYGGIKEQKAEDKYASKLYSTMKENFDGFSKNISDIYEKNEDGSIKYESGKPKVNIKKAADNTSEVVKEQIASQLMEAAALAGNKDAYDYYFNQMFSRFALPYLQEEGGIELLEKHIDNLSQELIKNSAAISGQEVKEIDENKYKQELKQQVKVLDKVFKSVQSTLTKDLEKTFASIGDPRLAGAFINRLQNTAYLETNKQIHYNKKIKELEGELAELDTMIGVYTPQSRVQAQSIQNKIQEYTNLLQESAKKYESVLNRKEQIKAFEEYTKENLAAEAKVVVEEEKEKTYESKIEGLKSILDQTGYTPEDFDNGFVAEINGKKSLITSKDITKDNIDKLKVIPKPVVEKENKNIEKIANLKLQKQLAEQELESIYEQLTGSAEEEIPALEERINELKEFIAVTTSDIKELSKDEKEQEQETDAEETSNGEVTEVKRFFEAAAKPTVFASAGNHEDAVKNNDLSALRWFNTISKLSNSDNYFLEFVTSEEAPEVFDGLSSDGKTTELEWENQNNYKGKGIKAILVDSNGNRVKANNDGTLAEDGNYVSTTIHTKSHVKKLNKNVVLFEYLQAVGNPYTLSDIKDLDSFMVGDTKFSKEVLLEKALSELEKTIDTLRANIKNELDNGRKVYSKVTSISSGIPNKLPMDVQTNKRQRNNILQSFVEGTKSIARIFVGDNKTTTTLLGKPLALVPGQVYVENKNGEVTDAINRTLNEEEVNLVIDLLSYSLADPNNIKSTIKSVDGKTEHPIFHNKNIKGENSLMSKLLFYGKAKQEYNKKHQIYADYQLGALFFGVDGMINFDQISTSPELREFLNGKFLNVNKNLLGKTESFNFPTKVVGDKIETRTIENKDGLGGYENFLLEGSNLTSDIVPINSKEPQYLQKYATYSTNIKTKIEAEEDVPQEATEEPQVILSGRIGDRGVVQTAPIEFEQEDLNLDELAAGMEAKKAYIERRRQEELNKSFKTAFDNEDITNESLDKDLLFSKENTQKDLQEIENIKQQIIQKETEILNKTGIEEYIEKAKTDKKWVFQKAKDAIDRVLNATGKVPMADMKPFKDIEKLEKDIKEREYLDKKREEKRGKINAKYDAELAALEPKTRVEAIATAAEAAPIVAPTTVRKSVKNAFNPEVANKVDVSMPTESDLASLVEAEPDFFDITDGENVFEVDAAFSKFYAAELAKNPSLTEEEAREYFKKCK